MERQPESEPEGESAEEGLTEDLARLSIARVEPERDLATFPAIVAYADYPGALSVAITKNRKSLCHGSKASLQFCLWSQIDFTWSGDCQDTLAVGIWWAYTWVQGTGPSKH